MSRHLVRRLWIVAVAVGAVGFGGCDWFDDPSPEFVSVSLTGDPGETVEILVSKQFLTGIDENDVTQVQIFQGDTLIRALPWDTTISIRLEQRFFVRSIDADSVSNQLRMQVRVDGVSEYDKSGEASGEFQFVFTFNQPITNVVELI